MVKASESWAKPLQTTGQPALVEESNPREQQTGPQNSRHLFVILVCFNLCTEWSQRREGSFIPRRICCVSLLCPLQAKGWQGLPSSHTPVVAPGCVLLLPYTLDTHSTEQGLFNCGTALLSSRCHTALPTEPGPTHEQCRPHWGPPPGQGPGGSSSPRFLSLLLQQILPAFPHSEVRQVLFCDRKSAAREWPPVKKDVL